MDEKIVNDIEGAAEAAENAKDAAAGVAENAKDTAAGVKEEIMDASEKMADAAGEVKDKIDADPKELRGQAPNSVPVEVKKGRKPFNKASIIAIVVAIVVVVAAVLFVGFNQGWFDFLKNTKGSMTLADTSRVEVYQEDIEVTDDDIEYYMDSLREAEQEEIEISEGETVEDGDTVNIDYKGTEKESGEAFEGGTAEGYDLTLGSGSFIEGFEDGLVGKKVGETVDLDLTFPEEYPNDETLAGKDVTFEVTINSAHRHETPELTDEWVKEYSEKYCPETYNTVEEFKNYCKETLVNYKTNSAIYQYLSDNSEVKSYDTEKENELMEYSNESLAYSATMYGMSEDDIASMYGYESAEAYNRESADNWLKISMIVDEVCAQKNITYTDEELDAAILQYMKDQKLIDSYTQEDFVEQSGDTWLWLFTNLEFRFGKAMQSLKDDVVVLEEKPTTEEDAALEEELDDELVEDIEVESVEEDAGADADAADAADSADAETAEAQETTTK